MDKVGTLGWKKSRLYRFSLLIALLWTLSLAGSLAWNMLEQRRDGVQIALGIARSAAEKDILYRDWNVARGGVYAEVTERHQPSAYLAHVPDRDVTTPSGRRLTLINVPNMLQQVYEMAMAEKCIAGQIKSLMPMRPENEPDEWEKVALLALHDGRAEFSSVDRIEGGQQLRYMRPLAAGKGCVMNRPQEEGTRMGDMIGGMSINVPLDPIYATMQAHMRLIVVGHLLFWLAGLGGIGLFARWHARGYGLQHAAEAAREEMRLRNELILRSTGDGIFGLDSNGCHTFVNPAAAAMLGYEAGELLGQHSHSLWHHTRKDGSPYPPEECPIYGVLRDGRYRAVEDEVFWRKDGSSFPAEYLGTAMVHEGSVVGVVVSFRDISARKKAEEEKSQLQEQFLQAQKMEVVGRLASGVAHDFNNILTIITGYSELVLNELPPDHPVGKDIRLVLEAGRKAAILTRQLLAFSRKQTLDLQLVHLDILVGELAKMLVRMIGEDVRLDLAGVHEVPVIQADPGQLEQVLMNLAVNARDAMSGGGVLTISTGDELLDEAFVAAHPGARPGRHVLLSVADSGCGMTPDVLSRIFEPFFTTKELGRGTGLGLATAFGIVKQHQGYIDVSSEPGRGTTFRIWLPVAAADGQRQAAPTGGEVRGGTETILVVEDNEPVRQLIVKHLAPLGYHILQAANGEDALDLLSSPQIRVDLLLSDVIMPGISGPELAKRLLARSPALRVVYMSGYPGEAVRRYGVLDDTADYLVKPVSAADLGRKVREVLDSRAAQA